MRRRHSVCSDVKSKGDANPDRREPGLIGGKKAQNAPARRVRVHSAVDERTRRGTAPWQRNLCRVARHQGSRIPEQTGQFIEQRALPGHDAGGCLR
jgi:hypothetical protein